VKSTFGIAPLYLPWKTSAAAVAAVDWTCISKWVKGRKVGSRGVCGLGVGSEVLDLYTHTLEIAEGSKVLEYRSYICL
jgi:hypothetical protein